MYKRTDGDFLSDIREAIYRITTYVAGMSYETFVADIKTQDAVIRNLEIIGEATKNPSEQLRIISPPDKAKPSVRRGRKAPGLLRKRWPSYRRMDPVDSAF